MFEISQANLGIFGVSGVVCLILGQGRRLWLV